MVTTIKGKSPSVKGNAKQVVWVERPVKKIRRTREAAPPVVKVHNNDAPPALGEVGKAAGIANNAPQPAEQRLNVRFTPEGYAQLQALAKRGNKSVSETVRDALGLLGWLDDQMIEGSQLILKQKDGKMFVVAKPKSLR